MLTCSWWWWWWWEPTPSPYLYTATKPKQTLHYDITNLYKKTFLNNISRQNGPNKVCKVDSLIIYARGWLNDCGGNRGRQNTLNTRYRTYYRWLTAGNQSFKAGSQRLRGQCVRVVKDYQIPVPTLRQHRVCCSSDYVDRNFSQISSRNQKISRYAVWTNL